MLSTRFVLTILVSAITINAQEVNLQEHVRKLLQSAQDEARKLNAEDVARLVYNHPFLTVAATNFAIKIPSRLLASHTPSVGNPLVKLIITGLLVKATAHAYLKKENIPHSHEAFLINYGSFLNTRYCKNLDSQIIAENSFRSDKSNEITQVQDAQN
ncbi:MAG: hypothetical protein ACOYT8_05420 [Candidatus Dependentiae bacterium]